ncbi:MAG TPA: AAA family ATPase [Armatimonadota bacterium]|nr:AAA family ATPase [Armatimonadota bacterium]
MRLKAVRVTNYKCVLDSDEFSVGPVTCLVGKNESGKTAILEALYKLKPSQENEGAFDDLFEYPRRLYDDYRRRAETQPDTAITTTWAIEENDVKALEAELGKGALKKDSVVVTKRYDNKVLWRLELDEKKVVRYLISSSGLDKTDRERYKDASSVKELISSLQQREGGSEHEEKFQATLTARFPNGSAGAFARKVLSDRLPRFVRFSEYQLMSGKVALEQVIAAEASEEVEPGDLVFLALLDRVGTTPEELLETQHSERLIARLEAASLTISEQIFRYWSQNRDLSVDCDLHEGRPKDPPPFNQGHVFETRILNRRHGVTLNFDERSHGFIWFFSFLVWFDQARRHWGDNVIILLDEPGLGLHAKAQQDLLRYINAELAPGFQVIYTTHSPFMVDPQELLRVRTVEDVVLRVDGVEEYAGTKVGDRVLSTDADTRFPLQAALGYEITQTLFVGANTLLVEGPSDLLYFKWFSSRLRGAGREGLDERWVIGPTGGIGKFMPFMALFGANKLNMALFSDYATGSKGKLRQIRESDLLEDARIFTADKYVQGSEADIEDLIGRASYMAIVNAAFGLKGRSRLDPEAQSHQQRVLKEVEEHFRLLKNAREFNHYEPAEYLTEHGFELAPDLPDLHSALDRFEKLFRDLNSCLSNI